MTHDEALAAAELILKRGTFSHRDTAELLTLEAAYPGVGLEAGERVVDPAHAARRSRESTPCEDVDYWADLRWSVDEIARPDAVAELVEILTVARASRKTVRMVGAARSDSLASTPGKGRLVASCALDAVLPVLTSALADGAEPATLYRCEAGRTAEAVIDDLQDQDLALANMGSGQFQGIVGAIMTATHGSGLTLPDMSGQVMAMQIVTFDEAGDVVIQQLARTGIFDPVRFAAAVADSPVPVVLVEDEDALLAAVVSFGTFGLVYSVTLRAVPQYWLHETRLPATWSELKSVLLEEAASYRNYEVLVSPLATEVTAADGSKRMDHGCLVTRRALVDATEPSGKRPLAMALSQTWVGHTAAGAVLVEATRHPLTVVPIMLHTGVNATVVEGYTDVSRKVLQLNLDLNAVGSELEVPVEKTVAAVDTLLDLAAANWAAMNERLGDHTDPVRTAFDTLEKAWREVPAHTSPISLRFVVGADAWMSMAQGGTRCMIELPMPGCTHFDEAVKRGSDLFEPKELKLYEAYLDGRNTLYRSTESALRAAVGARPHWGLVNFITGAEARASYPRWEDWMARYAVANRFGVFNGPLTDQLGISIESTAPEVGEAVVGEAAFHTAVDSIARVTLSGDLARHLFDSLDSPVGQKKSLCGRKKMGASMLVSTGPLRAELRFAAGGLMARTEDWKLAPRTGDAEGTGSLAHGVLQIDGPAGSALRGLLGLGGSGPVRLHVLNLGSGSLSLLDA